MPLQGTARQRSSHTTDKGLYNPSVDALLEFPRSQTPRPLPLVW